MIAQPDGVLYLADDVGDWHPNERDRYVAGKNLLTANSTQTNQIPGGEWPHNTQCTLVGSNGAAQSLVVPDSTDPSKATFRYRFRLKNWTGKMYVSVASCLDLNPIPGWQWAPGAASFCIAGANCDASFPQPGANGQPPQVLPAYLPSPAAAAPDPASMSEVRVTSSSGSRQVFLLRFGDPEGVQTLKEVYLNFSSNPALGAPAGSNNCVIQVSPLTNLIRVMDQAALSYVPYPVPPPPRDFALANSTDTLPWGNGLCSVYPQTSKIQFLSPSEILVRLDVEFAGAFAGTKYLFRNAFDWTSFAGWQNPDSASFVVQNTDSPRPNEISAGQNAAANLAALASVQACLDSQATECNLGPGIFDVFQQLQIKRSNVTLRGRSKHKTIVRRPRSGSTYLFTSPMIFVQPVSGTITGVQITDLTIEGNRIGGETSSPAVFGDVEFRYVDGSTLGTPGLRVANCIFKNAAWGAIITQPPLGLPSRGVVVEYNEFRKSIRAAIHVGLNAALTPSSCDAGLPTAAPQDIVIRNNLFENNDTGALYMESSSNVKIHQNAMLDNYDQGMDCGGGVITFGGCHQSSTTKHNFIWNRNVLFLPGFCGTQQQNTDRYAIAPAFEAYGAWLTISRNWIEYFSSAGIHANAVRNATIEANKIRNTSRAIHAKDSVPTDQEDDEPGIRIQVCAADRQTDNVTISGNEIGNLSTIYQSAAVKVGPDYCGGAASATNVFINIDTSNLLNTNRQGYKCRLPGTATTPNLPICEPIVNVVANPSCSVTGCSPPLY